MRGAPGFYVAFAIVVQFIIILRAFCKLDYIYIPLFESVTSVTSAKKMILPLDIIGLNPTYSHAIEFILFLTAVLFIADNLSRQNVFHDGYYVEKYSNSLEGFPEDYCYGIIDNPREALSLHGDKDGFLKKINASFSRGSLSETNHTVILLMIDVISFLVLMICYSKWSNGGLNGEGGSSNFSISIAMVFFLIIHLILSLATYFAQVNMKYGVLLFLNELWILFNICFTFFYIPSKRRGTQSSLQFYFFLRFLASLVTAHKCYIGRTFIGFNYPNFEKNWRSILLWNGFIRFCPFVFEIQTILFWMGQETFVSLKDYFVLRDVQTQLEMQIASSESPALKKLKDNSLSKRNSNKVKEKDRPCAVGFCLLLIMLLIMFMPLLFMTESYSGTAPNPPLSARIEMGLTGYPPFYTGYGSISSVDTAGLQSIVDVVNGSERHPFYQITKASISTLFLLNFPIQSLSPWSMPESEFSQLASLLKDNNFSIYYKIDLSFTCPTGMGSSYDTQLYNESVILNENQKAAVYEGVFDIQIPMVLFQSKERQLLNSTDALWNVTLEIDYGSLDDAISALKDGNNIFLSQNSISSDYDIDVFSNVTGFGMLLWSQYVPSEYSEISINLGTGLIGVYFLIIVTLAFVVRERATMRYNMLWLTKMENPKNLYTLVLAVEAYRTAGDVNKEKESIEMFLDKIKSPDKCIKYTS